MARNTLTITILTALLLLAGCIRDNSGLGELTLPELQVQTPEGDEMQTYNIDLGSELTITPEVSYANQEDRLEYVWSIGTYANGIKGTLKEVSRQKVLRHKFQTGGTYYAHLSVTDGSQGRAVDYLIHVNRPFEEGFVLVSNDENGSGNLAFIKTMTPEEIAAGKEQVYVEHTLELMNGMPHGRHLQNVVLGTISWPKALTRVLASLDDRCYFLDPNTFTVISEIKYTDVFEGFHADRFLLDDYYPFAYDAALKRYVHLDMQYMFAFEYQAYKGHTFQDFVKCDYSWGQATHNKMLFVDYDNPRVAEYNTYAAYTGTSNFPDTEDLLKGRTILGVFLGANINTSSYIVPEYVMARNGRRIELYCNTENSYIGPKSFEMQTLVARDEYAIPAQGTRFVSSPLYKRHFYAIGGRVYVLLTGNTFTLPGIDQPAITFSDTEEVTFMSVNRNTEELYVATYDTAVKRGSFYIFRTADVRADNTQSAQPIVMHRHVADRITNILYKPSINN